MTLPTLATLFHRGLSGPVAALAAEAFQIGFPRLKGSGLLDFVVGQVEAQFPKLTAEDKDTIAALVHALAAAVAHFAARPA